MPSFVCLNLHPLYVYFWSNFVKQLLKQIMKKRMIRYKVKKEKVAENEALIKEVYRQLKEKQPKDLSYATYKLEDGQTFVHLVSHDNEGAYSLTELPAFRNFQANIKDRYEEPAVVMDITEIGSYGFGA